MEVRLLAGESGSSDVDFGEIISQHASAAAGSFSIVPRLHAKLVLVDDAALISSYNFLSADPFSTAADARDLGIHVTSAELADRLWGWVRSLG